MEAAFNAAYERHIATMRKPRIPSSKEYQEILHAVRRFTDKKSTRHLHFGKSEQNWVRSYFVDVEAPAGVLHHRNVFGKNRQVVVKCDDLFDLLKTTHETHNHARRDVMWRHLRRYYGVSKSIISLFLEVCEQCAASRRAPTKASSAAPPQGTTRSHACPQCQCATPGRVATTPSPISVTSDADRSSNGEQRGVTAEATHNSVRAPTLGSAAAPFALPGTNAQLNGRSGGTSAFGGLVSNANPRAHGDLLEGANGPSASIQPRVSPLTFAGGVEATARLVLPSADECRRFVEQQHAYVIPHGGSRHA